MNTNASNYSADDDSRVDANRMMRSVPEEAFYRLTVHLVGGITIMRDYSDFFEARRDARDLTEPLGEGIVKDWCDDHDNEAFIVSANITAVCIEQLPPYNDLPPFLGRIHCEKAALPPSARMVPTPFIPYQTSGKYPTNNAVWL